MNCPKDGHTLEFISGTFGTGVFAPDGGQETLYQEGWQCPKCETIYDESDVSETDFEGAASNSVGRKE
jgi:hypothetical protein